MTYIDEDHSDKMHEECGVFGIAADNCDVARLTYFGLFSLQHRGQESAGIAVQTGSEITCHKDMGLVSQIFNETYLNLLKGRIAIGHVRYSTTGASVYRNAQPITIADRWNIALAHNGNLVNNATIREKLENEGIIFTSTTDSETMAEVIARGTANSIEGAIIKCMETMQGAFSTIVLAEGRIYAFRDPNGIRPLSLGRINHSGYVVASESCAFDIIGAELIRDVDPGELVEITPEGIRTVHKMDRNHDALCAFEFIYFARPDSIISGRRLYTARKMMGRLLASQSPIEADIVMSIPDSSTPAAIGYAEASGIPYQEGLIKNRYVGRTFIAPEQRLRTMGVRMKLNPIRENIEGKRIVLVDDSIVRGTTSSKIVSLLRENGAKEVHMRVSSPPITHPCFYGIDMAKTTELIAATHSIDEIAESLGCDSLHYLNIENLVAASGLPLKSLCLACFNGDYPIFIPRQLDLANKMAYEPEGEQPE